MYHTSDNLKWRRYFYSTLPVLRGSIIKKDTYFVHLSWPSSYIVYDTIPDICIKFRSLIKVKLATIVEGDQKALFSIAATLRCRGGCYSFPWIPPLYPWYIPYIAEYCKEVSSTIFKVWCDLGLNPGLPGQWWTLFSNCYVIYEYTR